MAPTLRSKLAHRKVVGFTLIELLIVIAIILILIAIALPNFLEAQIRAKVVRVEADTRTIATALESYFLDWGIYPNQSEDEFDNDAHGLSQLTTPLTYLAELPFDVFVGSQGRAVDGLPVYFEMASTGMEPREVMFGLRPTLNVHAYALYSHGPDVIDDFHGEGDWPFGGSTPQCGGGIRNTSDSATNGTRSLGDLPRLGGEWKSGHWCFNGIEIVGRGFDCPPNCT